MVTRRMETTDERQLFHLLAGGSAQLKSTCGGISRIEHLREGWVPPQCRWDCHRIAGVHDPRPRHVYSQIRSPAMAVAVCRD